MTGDFADTAYRILIIAILTLLGMTIIFGALVIVLRYRNHLVARRWNRLEQEWESRVLDVLSGDNPVDDMRAFVTDGDRARYLSFLARFARPLRGRERRTLRLLARPHLQIVERQLQARAPEVRARVVLTLNALGGRVHRRRLIHALDDPSPLVAMVAARSLARAEYVQHAGEILSRIHRFERWNQRYLAAMFAAIGPDVAPSLRQTLLDENASERGRVVAAEALLILQDLAAAEAARTVIRRGATPNITIAALRLLRSVGNSSDAELIRSLVATDVAPVRSAAFAAIGSLGDSSDVAAVEAAVSDSSPWVALNAAGALAELGALDTLRRIADSGSELPMIAAREALEQARWA